MIIRTKIEWTQEKKLDELEKQKLEAKAEFEPDFDPFEEMYEDSEKEAIIDTNQNKVYVAIEPGKICVMNLLGAEYIVVGKSVQRFQERVTFEGDLDEIYNNLNTK